MPRKHQVRKLVDLALYSIGEFVTIFGRNLTRHICTISKTNPDYGHTKLHSMLEYMKHLLTFNVPRHLYDKMSKVILTAIVNLMKQTRGTYNDYALTTAFLSEMTIALHLTEVAVDAHLRTIEFSAWPKIMRHILYNKLSNMIGLEVLDLGSGSAGWRTSDIEKVIISGVTAMPNLVCFTLCFDCTDNIIAALARSCKKLQKLDVTASRSVTERSVVPLLSCKYLKQIKLCRTSMTISGYSVLFLEHLYIEDIGRCDEFGYVLEHIQQKEVNATKSSFRIRTFESRNFHMEHLYLLVGMCPYITSLCLLRDERIIDLTILAALDYLKELKLLSCDFYTHGIKRLLEVRGRAIINLHLEHVDEIDLNALISISQYCPDINSLVFYNCEFLEHAPVYSRKLAVLPFQRLERMKCVVECANMHLEFLLSHCKSIKFIQLGSSTGIEDDTMRRIFLLNPLRKLEELKILYSHDLSMKTVQLLIQHCDHLYRLSELENWQGISPTELIVFREELKNSNIDLDTSPIVTIDLKSESFTPGKKNYERTQTALRNRFTEKFDVIVSWNPPDQNLCPSSVAAWFHKHKYNVCLCHQSFLKRIEYSLSIPVISNEFDCDKFFEWLGLLSVSGDLKNDKEDNYVNTYVCPSPSTDVGQVQYLQWTGFFTRIQVIRLYNVFKEFVLKQDNLPWAALHVQGFLDSPVSWDLKEHTFYTDGDNSYTVVLRPAAYSIVRKSLCSNNKPRIFQ